MNSSARRNRIVLMPFVFLAIGCLVLAVEQTAEQCPEPIYKNDFESEKVGAAPPDFLVLDGAFTVKEERDNKFLELPGAPLDGFGALFGPTQTDSLQVTARARSVNQGRRMPVFGVGLNGVGGFRLMVSAGKKSLEIFQGDLPTASVKFDWQPGAWTWLKLQARQMAHDKWRIEGKAWLENAAEPPDWMIWLEIDKQPPAGRPSIWASPISGHPIQFDDLSVTQITSSVSRL